MRGGLYLEGLIRGGAYFWNFMVLFEVRVDDLLWTSNAFPVARLFQNKAMFLLMIMLIYDKPLLSGQPPLSGLVSVPRFNCIFIRPSSQRTCDYRTPL